MSPAERDRFLRALQDDPEFRAEVSRQLLSRELVELPERFARFSAHVEGFIEEQSAFNEEQSAFNAKFEGFIEEQSAFNENQSAFNAKFEGFIEEQKGFNAKFEGFIEEQKGFNAKFEGFIEEQKGFNTKFEGFIEEQKGFNAKVDTSIARIETNIGILKGNVARRVLRDHHETILELLRLDFVNILQRSDLTRLVRTSGMANEIEFGQRRSFYAADLVLVGTDAAGDTHYVAAEASFTADSRDTGRAIRNAEFLTRFTGQPSHSVVASVLNDREVQEMVNAGAIYWFQLDEREFDAD